MSTTTNVRLSILLALLKSPQNMTLVTTDQEALDWADQHDIDISTPEGKAKMSAVGMKLFVDEFADVVLNTTSSSRRVNP